MLYLLLIALALHAATILAACLSVRYVRRQAGKVIAKADADTAARIRELGKRVKEKIAQRNEIIERLAGELRDVRCENQALRDFAATVLGDESEAGDEWPEEIS